MGPYLALVYHYIRIYVSNEEDVKDIVQESGRPCLLSRGRLHLKRV